MSTKSAGARLRAVMATEAPLQMPGAINAYSAMLAERAGFKALYVSGAGIANASFGLPDLGMTSLNDVCEDIRRISGATPLPILVDADTGWGAAFNIQRTVKELIRAGAAACHIEDQVQAKRCGHRPGKALVPKDDMVDRIKAAVDGRQDPEFVIVARTDAVAVEGLDAALERAEAYLACGVDALFIEAVRTPAQMDQACSRFAHRVPMLANMVEGGKTPVQSVEELGRRGYRIVIFPGGTARFAVRQLQRYYGTLKAEGSTLPMRDEMLDFDQLNALIGTPELLALGSRYAS